MALFLCCFVSLLFITVCLMYKKYSGMIREMSLLCPYYGIYNWLLHWHIQWKSMEAHTTKYVSMLQQVKPAYIHLSTCHLLNCQSPYGHTVIPENNLGSQAVQVIQDNYFCDCHGNPIVMAVTITMVISFCLGD